MNPHPFCSEINLERKTLLNKTLSKPDRKFAADMLYGMLASGSYGTPTASVDSYLKTIRNSSFLKYFFGCGFWSFQFQSMSADLARYGLASKAEKLERQRKSNKLSIFVAFEGKTGSKINEKQRKWEKKLYFVAFSTKKATEIVEFIKIRCF